ncbi:MAG: sugar ABC transporter substrate-binding protein [Spirochaetales bacterium]|uniref:Sugar ABC transporter substrate-binding protein n=1 Tax=Candidatus Thalassospirochaeta sargassi TaxID=3119039 RepID=A0AAJ1IDR5_9SPIO|nr:sugar ABC transporter substrate-binding protein [Spirochaetales bacterium]
MRKVILMVLAIMLVMSTAVFSGGQQENGVDKYALMMSHMTNSFTITLSNAVKAAAEDLGVELVVFDGGQDVSKQISQVESAINQGYAGILIEPASVDGIKPAVTAASKAGIPIVTINQKITNQELADAFVGVEHVEGGEIEMKYVVEAIGGKGKIAFLLGPLGSDGQIGRTTGYYNILEDYPDIEVVYEQSANWRTDEALKLAENWLQTGVELVAIVANNDGMAMGALKAVEDAKMLDKIKIFGVDATDDALAAVAEGRLSATVSQSTEAQALAAMDALVKLANGEDVPSEIIVGHTLITKENVADFQ